MAETVGILAYGSLIGDPGPEIEPYITRRISCRTPFNVEFARTSRTRKGGPTLVPYDDGSVVAAQILMVSYPSKRRLTGFIAGKRVRSNSNISYVPPKTITPNTVVVESLRSFEGIETVLYTKIGANIEGLTAPSSPNLRSIARAPCKTAKMGLVI